MIFGLLKNKVATMGFSQDSRVFFKLDKANLNISQLALKLENTKLISDVNFREEFLFLKVRYEV